VIALDTSILAYAVNRYAPEHPRAARIVEELANGDQAWALPWPVVHDFMRWVTHAHVVARPLSAGDAAGFVEELLASPSVQLLSPGPAHLAAVLESLDLVRGGEAMPPGLEIAALLREHGVREILSADRDLKRFGFLTVIDPFHGSGWTPAATPARRHRVLGGSRRG
jgi:uncharacterized protein